MFPDHFGPLPPARPFLTPQEYDRRHHHRPGDEEWNAEVDDVRRILFGDPDAQDSPTGIIRS